MRWQLILGLSMFSFTSGCGPSSGWQAAEVGGESMMPPPAVVGQSSGSSFDDTGETGADSSRALQGKIAQFATAKIRADLSSLSVRDKKTLQKLIEASKLLDPIFDRQVYAHNPALGSQLKADKSAVGQARYTYWQIHRGPWDRQDHFAPFAIGKPRPSGAGFYPEDLGAAEFDRYLGAHPGQRKQLLSLFTVVKRQGKKLVAVPYRQEYAEWLKPAAKRLREAAALTDNKSLRRYLLSRAAAFASDNYYQSDKDWMDLDSPVEITIGPYEVYEDRLKASKAAFESFVTVADAKASKLLAKYKGLLTKMEQNLPVPQNVKTKRGSESPIRVVDLVFTSGDARKSVQTIAFNLPNDERVRKEKGAKKVMLRNVIRTKFDLILKPIARRIINKKQLGLLSADAFFNQVLFHELSHSLGPAHTLKNGKKVEIREALESTYSALEECKADTMGVYNILYMIKLEQFDKAFRDKVLVSYFAGLFRSLRFGVVSAHGKGAAIQINRYLESGAARFDSSTGRFSIDLDKLVKSVTDLTRDLVMLQHKGDKAAAVAMLAKYGKMSPAMRQALTSVKRVPVDLRPVYPAAGE